MKSLSQLSKDEIEKIEFYTQQGMMDKDIVKMTDAQPFVVQKITTQYWERKMKEKNESQF